MDKIKELTDKVSTDLHSLPEVQEFLRLKELMASDKELANMRSDIARLTSEKKEEEKNNLIAIYNSHPIVNNYNVVREEVMNILQTIKDILSES
jgi:cell fate (sporulation/competence/biofilm development) regulator YmcA (YheA/YmcA/DUF963 family)